ncbi:MAG: hypothetical protein HY807_03920 [Nitrospirae bacterium]|nr:hypothetical protein [Nitrospirota bacterium]
MQVANVLYEIGIVLFAVMKALPPWANTEYLVALSNILKVNRTTQEAMGLSECPLCGRFTTCIYGTGTDNNPCRCRWCVDREGRAGIRIILDNNQDIALKTNSPFTPIFEEIVPLRKSTPDDPRDPLRFTISLPLPQAQDKPEQVFVFWQNLLRDKKTIIKNAFICSLTDLLNAGKIKRFKDISAQSYYWDHPSTLSAHDIPLDEFSLIDFVKEGFHQVGYAAFEVGITHCGSLRAPSQISSDSESSFEYIGVNYPWEIRLHSANIKNLRTQDNYRFKVFIGINFPLLQPTALPPKTSCHHDFRALYLGTWEWRLVWECRNCGFTCYCSCFEKAIKASPYRKDYLEIFGKQINIRPSELHFHEKACDICRDYPSSNIFCHAMYARSIFEIRYGAYVRKRMVELKLENYNKTDEKELEIVANNLVRQELGFSPIGEKWATETELYRIIKSLFPDQQVIHHYRSQWLERLELDIYVPGQKLGIEYHGIQHFEPMDIWGGTDGLARSQERDSRKIILCKANNIELISFTYEEDINLKNVKSKLLENGYNFT